MDYGSLIMDYGLLIMDYGSLIMDYGFLRVRNPFLRIPNPRLQYEKLPYLRSQNDIDPLSFLAKMTSIPLSFLARVTCPYFSSERHLVRYLWQHNNKHLMSYVVTLLGIPAAPHVSARPENARVVGKFVMLVRKSIRGVAEKGEKTRWVWVWHFLNTAEAESC